MLVRAEQDLQKQVQMVRHHAKLMELHYGKVMRETQQSLCDYFAQWRFIDSRTARIAVRDSGIACYASEGFAGSSFLQNNVIDEGIVIVMMNRAPMVRMNA